MANFSTLEALDTLCKSIPEWNSRLDKLNGQIALRQAELAQLEVKDRPPTRSVKHKGSTESLRPNDQHENPFLSSDADDIQLNPFDTPKSNHNGFSSTRKSSPPSPPRVVKTPPPAEPVPAPNPRSPTNIGSRKPSQTTPAPVRNSPANLRKRKTESLASGESHTPKYRTRSMIIVYYDSAVQQAFEDLVKFISASRNAMRKGKMAAKMAQMKRAAELEVDDDEEEEVSSKMLTPDKKFTGNGNGNGSTAKDLPTPSSGIIASDSDSAEELPLPKLKFVSTRQMGPSRDMRRGVGAIKPESGIGPGVFRSYRRSGADEVPDIFDELDKGLEWSQGQCEHAAHQFLRDGDCSTEITNIKRKLLEVKEGAMRETEKLKKEEELNPTVPDRTPVKEPSSHLQQRSPQLRRQIEDFKGLEVDDDMEVDDEDGDDGLPITLDFKRSRDLVP